MNLAISTTSARTLRVIKTHYVVLITGAILAGIALFTVASFSVDSGSSAGRFERPILPAASALDQKYVTFYLVDSEAGRERVAAMESFAQSERWSNNIPEPNYSYGVFVVRTPNEVGSAQLSIFESAGSLSDTIVNVVDLLPPHLKR